MKALYERTKGYAESIKQRQALFALLDSWETAQWFITLRFNREISYAGAKEKLSQFHARVDRLLLGKNWSRSEDRTKFVAVPEKQNGTLHYHLLLRLPAASAKKISALEIGAIWKTLVRAGSVFVEPIMSNADQKRIAGYMGKDGWKGDGVIENFVLSAELIGEKGKFPREWLRL